MFSQGIRFYLWRHVGPHELDDRVHDIFLIVLEAIRNGEVREPERLMGFVRTIVRRQIACYIDNSVQRRREHSDLTEVFLVADCQLDPERVAMDHERSELMLTVLRSIDSRDREILTRFYLLGQPADQIQLEMRLTETQFRLLKSRAKLRFGEQGRKQVSRAGSASSLRNMLIA